MVYVLIDGLTPNKVLPRYKIVVFTYDFGEPRYSELWANPVHGAALIKAGFTKLYEVDGNAHFRAETVDQGTLAEMFSVAFDNSFWLCLEEDEVPYAVDYDETTLREAILHIWEVNREEWSGKHWGTTWLFDVVRCVEWDLFETVLAALVQDGKFKYVDTARLQVVPVYF